MFKRTDQEPAEVPNAALPKMAKQAGPAPNDRWSWVEPAAWTKRMLTALDKGVQGGVWFSLMDKVYSLWNLQAAWTKVLANRGAAGVDHISVAHYQRDVLGNLERVQEELRSGAYAPQDIRRHWIPKPGSSEKRPLGIPTVRDRVVQTALVHVIEPILDATFHERSFGFRHGRGCHQALRCVDQLLEDGYVYVVDADLKGYF